MSSENKLEKQDDDLIDIVAIIKVLWQEKKTILSSFAIVSLLSIIYSFMLPNIYQGSALLFPTKAEGAPKIGGITQSIASFSGISFGGGEANRKDIAIATLQSRKFITEFIKRHSILPQLMAIESWDKASNTPDYNENIYAPDEKVWNINNGNPPSNWDAYFKFKSLLSITEDAEKGLITISFDFPDPNLARQWVELLVKDINEDMRQKEINTAQEESVYLREQLSRISVSDIRTIFFQLIEENLKKILLAETRDEFVLTTIDPAITPKYRVSPNRALIAILGGILGGIIGLAIVFYRSSRKNQ